MTKTLFVLSGAVLAVCLILAMVHPTVWADQPGPTVLGMIVGDAMAASIN